ncbi:MAG: SAM-dependent chlorinase/fluorinase [Candidatus Omnitrophica bacterium]|nr:SAM-dependent chlorinase/fluorinase [Candidatus Omnitrophota bacterium]
MVNISLLTDFGLEDNFVGVMKGVIAKINPQARTIDITHSIEAQNILQAGFILRSSFSYFPKGTIHLAIVDPGVGSRERKAIIVKTRNYFFVAPDNGILSLTLEKEKPVKIIEIKNTKYFLKPVSCTFHGRDIFAPVAAYLSRKIKPEAFGTKLAKLKKLDSPCASFQGNVLKGSIIHVDRFGNLITNIEKSLFDSFVGKSGFKVRFKNEALDRISTAYVNTLHGFPLAIFGSFNTLEVSINKGSACDYFKARLFDPIEIVK